MKMKKAKLLVSTKLIDLTKGDQLYKELKNLYQKEKLYYINLFEGDLPIMIFKMSGNKILKETIYTGLIETKKISEDLEESQSGTVLIEADVKGWIDGAVFL
jgi:hypothetical protein